MAPISRPSIQCRSNSQAAAMPVRPVVTSTPRVASDNAGQSATRKLETRVRRPPSRRITASARLPTVGHRIVVEDDAADPVVAGDHADGEEDHQIGMPRREDSELTRMLMPTSTAPIRKKLLTVTASKVGLLAAGQGKATLRVGFT